MSTILSVLFMSTVCFLSDTKKVYFKKINSYLNAASVVVKSKYLADDYHSFFIERKGEGEEKADALQSFQNWDGPLNPDVKIPGYTVDDRNWLIKFNDKMIFQNSLVSLVGWVPCRSGLIGKA